MRELNPHHPMTAAVRTEWHKICAILVHKFSGSDVLTITPEDVEAFIASGNVNIAIQENVGGIHLSLLNEKQAQAAARLAGGIPN